jgi:hypothetical protein
MVSIHRPSGYEPDTLPLSYPVLTMVIHHFISIFYFREKYALNQRE